MELMHIETPEGLTEKEVNPVKEAFRPVIEEISKYEERYLELAKIDGEPTKEQAAEARAIRLKIVKCRTSSDKIHKTQKAHAQTFARYVDGMKTKIKSESQVRESRLRLIEDWEKDRANEKLEAMINSRNTELAMKGLPQNPDGIDTMDADQWKRFVKGAVLLAKEEAAEAKRLRDKEIAEQNELDRLRKEKEIRDAKEREEASAREAEEKRKADVAHRTAVEAALLESLIKVPGVTLGAAKAVVFGVTSGNIPELKIVY